MLKQLKQSSGKQSIPAAKAINFVNGKQAYLQKKVIYGWPCQYKYKPMAAMQADVTKTSETNQLHVQSG